MTIGDAQLERNKKIVRSFKECQGTKDQDATMREIMSPDYRRIRGGLVNLADNAHGQGWPEPGLFLRKALPDRVDRIEAIVGEGDRVAMLWRLNATHTGNLFGIPPTGKPIDIYEAGFFKVVDGKIVEGWFMCDELGILLQVGRQLPKRNDGRIIAPHVEEEGDAPDTLVDRLVASGKPTQQELNKARVAKSRSRLMLQDDRGERVRRRNGLPQLHEYGERAGFAHEDIDHAFPDRSDSVVRALAEGDSVWMRYNMRGTNTQSFYGHPPTGERCVVSEVAIAKFSGDAWVEEWYMADGLGALLKLGAVDMLGKLGCAPA